MTTRGAGAERGDAGPQPAGPHRPHRPAPRATGRRGWPGRLRRGWQPRRGEAEQDRFGLLLLVIVVTYLLSAFTSGLWVNALQVVLFLAVTVLSISSSPFHRRTRQVLAWLALGGSAVAVTLLVTRSAGAVTAVGNLWAALILLFAVAVIVRRVLAYPVVTLQSIFGAVSAYMILGLMFAAIFSAMNRFGGGTFFVHGEHGNLQTFQYFSFTTLTTLGYGDFTAAAPGGQAVAVIEALFGQVFLATLVARLVSAFRGPGRSDLGTGSATARPATRRRRPPHPSRAARAPSSAATRIPPAAATRTSSRGRARPARR